jgi:hypothetical protein
VKHKARGPLKVRPRIYFGPVRENLFWNLKNKVDLLKHVLSKFEHSTQSAPETPFLTIQIKNTTL